MSPVTHALIGWAVANATPLSRKERVLITLASVVPDLDALGMLVDFITRRAAHPTYWYDAYHHVLGHNLAFALVVTALTLLVAERRTVTATLSFLSFHLHLVGDLLGSRGPDGYQWPIPYLAPFSDTWQLTWQGQWALNAWPNFLLTGSLLVLTFYLAWQRGHSPLEIVSQQADAAFVAALRRRFGEPRTIRA